jgi:hypothetical protein
LAKEREGGEKKKGNKERQSSFLWSKFVVNISHQKKQIKKKKKKKAGEQTQSLVITEIIE